jgi:hypothetical protein
VKFFLLGVKKHSNLFLRIVESDRALFLGATFVRHDSTPNGNLVATGQQEKKSLPGWLSSAEWKIYSAANGLAYLFLCCIGVCQVNSLDAQSIHGQA